MDWKNKLEAASLAEIAGVGSAVVYFTGYLISSLYIRSRGINEMSLVSTQYIETGFVFVLLTALFIAVPLIILNMALDSHRRHGYPNLLLSLVFPLVTSNYLYVFVFFCLFVTRYEWLLRFTICGFETGLIACFVIYTVMLSLFQLAFLYLKYDAVKRAGGFVPELDSADNRPVLATRSRRLMCTSVMAASVLTTAAFDYVLLTRIGWFPMFLSRAGAYIFCIVLIIVVASITSRLTHIYTDKWKRWKFWAVACPLLFALYYFAVSSYEFGVYINIPMSRGGKYPVTVTTLHFNPGSSHSAQGVTSLSVYVIEETADRYYVIPTDISNWFHGHPSVRGINKAEVAFPYYEHLKSGEPRINHLQRSSPADGSPASTDG
jgi:hypothetical protein